MDRTADSDALAGPARARRERAALPPLLACALGLAVLCGAVAPAAAADDPQASQLRTIGLRGDSASRDARRVAAWVIATGDHQGMPFLLIDKVEAKVFAFDRSGHLLGVTPALLGLGSGDESPEGIGERKLSTISPAERVTPAGRFIAALGENLSGKDILWVDYAAAISLHRVDTATPAERRLQRLASPSASDNRISYGCINVPAAFFDDVVQPLFRGRVGVVYVLPEERALEAVFFPGEMLLAEQSRSTTASSSRAD